MPADDRVKQTSAYLRMLLLRPGEYRNRWERASARVEAGAIDYDAVERVLAAQPDGAGADAAAARTALDGTALDETILGLFVDAFGLSARHSARLWNLMRGPPA